MPHVDEPQVSQNGDVAPSITAGGDDGVHPKIAPDDPATDALRAMLALGVRRMRAYDPAARQGAVEGVHRLRTTSRRLRSALRAFGDLVDPIWSEPLQGELKWLAGRLGAVRDHDVLRDRLREAAGDSVTAFGPLFTALDERHARATEALREALQSERYQILMDRLAAIAEDPAYRGDAWEPCRTVLPPLVAKTWKALKKRGRALDLSDPAEDFHEVRIRAKRARYAADAVADALGDEIAKDAHRFARLATKVQDALGEHQDAIVAGQEIRRVAAEHPQDGPFNLAAGQLLERQEHAARAARAAFFEVWDELDRKKVRRWFQS